MTRIDFARALTYPLEDNEWVLKLLIGAVLLLIGFMFSIVLVGLIAFVLLTGYMIAIARNVAEGRDVPLPPWEDFATLFLDGLKASVAFFIWQLPALFFALPLPVVFALPGRDDRAMASIMSLLILCCSLPAFAYSLFIALIFPIVMWQVADKGSIAAGLHVDRVLRILRTFPAEVILITIALGVLGLLAGIVGSLLCGIGLLPTTVWYIWAGGHLIGQLGRIVRSREAAAEGAV